MLRISDNRRTAMITASAFQLGSLARVDGERDTDVLADSRQDTTDTIRCVYWLYGSGHKTALHDPGQRAWLDRETGEPPAQHHEPLAGVAFVISWRYDAGLEDCRRWSAPASRAAARRRSRLTSAARWDRGQTTTGGILIVGAEVRTPAPRQSNGK